MEYSSGCLNEMQFLKISRGACDSRTDKKISRLVLKNKAKNIYVI